MDCAVFRYAIDGWSVILLQSQMPLYCAELVGYNRPQIPVTLVATVPPRKGRNKGGFMTRILLLGLDPEAVDYSDPALPQGMNAEKIHAGIAVVTSFRTNPPDRQSSACCVRQTTIVW